MVVVGFGRRKPQNLFYSYMRTTCPVAYVMRAEHAEIGLVCLTPARLSYDWWHALLRREVVKQPDCITSNNCITKVIVHRTNLIAPCLTVNKKYWNWISAGYEDATSSDSLFTPGQTHLHLHKLPFTEVVVPSRLGKYLMQCNRTWERYHQDKINVIPTVSAMSSKCRSVFYIQKFDYKNKMSTVMDLTNYGLM